MVKVLRKGHGVPEYEHDSEFFTTELHHGEGCSNNEAEHEVVIAGLELCLEVPIDDLTIYGNSKLIVKQLKGEYQIKKPNLLPYYERENYMLSKFPKLQI
ncbi:hypothetical protein RJ640_011324 [Escallonia rubra]|uniref:RNase H type-1 domain-containing protein n=1 Tax=Escallonia rubra TaxID=112253 RepID=A0AA88QT81_9ASTE|nr:hypothetical protein RJ640_011324 [Escallonia rubra]